MNLDRIRLFCSLTATGAVAFFSGAEPTRAQRVDLAGGALTGTFTARLGSR